MQRKLAWISVLCTMIGLAHVAKGQDSQVLEPDAAIHSTQRLIVEQIAELISAGQTEETLHQLRRLGEMPSALVRRGSIQVASTQRVQVYQSLDAWSRGQLRTLLANHLELQTSYYAKTNALGKIAYRSFQESKDLQTGYLAVSQYHATSHGPALIKLLVDLHLEHEQCLAALEVFESSFPELMRIDLSLIDPKAPSVALPWYRVWQAVTDNPAMAERVLQAWVDRTKHQVPLSIDVLIRQWMASAVSPKLLEWNAIDAWTKVVAAHTDDPSQRQRLQDILSAAVSPPETNSKTPNRSAFDSWPRWQAQLDHYSNASDLTPATKPAVGQIHSTLPYHPTLYEGKVFIHELTRIRAFDTESGRTWPTPDSQKAVFDSQIAPEAYLPLGYPLQGTPRGELTIYEGCLYARMGSPVSAWANRPRSSDGGSQSYLIGLDLAQQGRLLRGFPLSLNAKEFSGAEFEGSPTVSGQNVIAAIVERDHANIRRSLVAFDRFSGRLVWRSKVLGSGVVVGSQQCNLIASTQPTVAGGLVYYNSDLGTVACLDTRTGRILWLSSYTRIHRPQSGFPRPNRYRYRVGNPCLVHRGLVYCCPQDAPEIIALDALTGDLVWATDDVDVSDCNQMIGIYGNTLVACGDRLVWLDRSSGQLSGRYPEQTTPGIVNSLPQPRGLGRAAIVGDKIYWPVSGEILVLEADGAFFNDASSSNGPLPWPVLEAPKILERIPMGARGIEGGNLAASGPWFLIATPGRLLCLAPSAETP